jgi:cyclopropane fatty-acyl-phospholipid synthase-like methyltransferase
MNLSELVQRTPVPAAWSEGDNIPWNEPGFSARMLKEHLTQEHDAASRRTQIIDRHVAWIHTALLDGRPSRVLDLGCGPGLYASRLARLGHTCQGIDFSPASIAYAADQAAQEGLQERCAYRCEDIRAAGYGSGYDLVMLIFGEFNVFSPQNAARILEKAWQALKPGGLLLLEPHTFEIIKKNGTAPAEWYSSSGGLFSAQPHIVLVEQFWDEAAAASTTRYFIVDAQSGGVTRFASSFQAYTQDQYRAVLEQNGFCEVTFYPSLALGEVDPDTPMISGLLGLTGRKK